MCDRLNGSVSVANLHVKDNEQSAHRHCVRPIIKGSHRRSGSKSIR
jgi:hypothetical protein